MAQHDSRLIDAAARAAMASPLMDAAERAGLFSYVSVPLVDPPAPPSPPPEQLLPPPSPCSPLQVTLAMPLQQLSLRPLLE